MNKMLTYEELKQKVTELEGTIRVLKSMEQELFECLKSDDNTLSELDMDTETSFIGLDEDESFARVERNIQMLEAYEFYLSKAMPVNATLNNAVSTFPILEPLIEKIMEYMLEITEEDTGSKKIIKHLLQRLTNDYEALS